MYDQSLIHGLFRDQLTLCGVREGERVTVLSRGRERLDYADAFMYAARSLGATAFHLRLPHPLPDTGTWSVGATELAASPQAVEALKQSDMLVDLAFLLFSPEQFAIQAAGTRILTVVEPIELLARLAPSPALRERVEAAAGLLEKASTLRFTNEHGTDVTYRLGAYPTVPEYGYTDTPGRWDHWPAGFVFTGAADDGVDGRIVLGPGDVLLPQNQYVTSRVEFTIEKGFITDIRGGFDADLIRSYITSFDDPRGYGMSHIGWGLDERAHWHGLAQPSFPGGIGMELRSVYGNVMFSIGPNSELGGPNDTACHLDIPMRGCSLFLDEEPVVVDGDIAVPDLRAPSRR
ncbi:leucyl aminopeptidase [Actinomadura sp. NAK00032]|uniref:leucyl aminopeptidase n=1 Tax=Actinomadura sp. NAK00032 TaxID=2742128 RepID=UPI001590785B|nr:leucyl aminopeptidase [Actinomadura sp. NAK00032]QKW33181.1 leucyl aminopeptidase [Actinomadura sp. NAK00032]